MSENKAAAPGVSSEAITLAEIRGRALAIRDEVKQEITYRVEDRRNQLIAAGVVAVVVVIGLAYLVGSRAGRRAAGPRLR
jgi:hypothetical protein